MQPVPHQQMVTQFSDGNFARSDYGQMVANPQQGSVPYLESRVANLEAQIQSLQIGADCWGDSKCDGCQAGGFYAGAAVVWAKPHFKEAFQYSQTNVLNGQQTLFPFDYDYEASPRIWAGYRNPDGVGVRATYWNFDATGNGAANTSDGFNIYGAHAITIIFPANIFAAAPGSTLTTQDQLETEITNLYGTYDTNLNDIEVSVGAGLRYARLRQSLSATVSGSGPAASLNWTREYDGLGPSITLDAKKQLGETRFSAVAAGGGSLLFGTKSINRTVIGDQSPQPASPFLRLNDADEVVGIGELSLGLEWATTTRRGSQLSVRGTYESQLWAEAGAPTLGFLGFQGFGIQAELSR